MSSIDIKLSNNFKIFCSWFIPAVVISLFLTYYRFNYTASVLLFIIYTFIFYAAIWYDDEPIPIDMPEIEEEPYEVFDIVQLPNTPRIDKVFHYFHADDLSMSEVDSLRTQIEYTFTINNLLVRLETLQHSAKYISFYYTIDTHNTSDKQLKLLIPKLEIALGIYGIHMNTKTGIAQQFILNIPRNSNNKVGMLNALEDEALQDFLMDNQTNGKLSVLPIIFGYDDTGNLSFTDLHKQPSMLIGGSSGSGKSTLLHSMLSILLAYNNPENLNLYMVDTKLVELNQYEGLPHVKRIVYQHEEFAEFLNEILDIINDRYSLFSQLMIKDILEYKKLQPMPFIVIVLEELGDLMLDSDKQIHNKLIKILQKGRACGVHVIAATQRCSTDIINGSVKSNMPCRVAMKVSSSTDSKIIVDKTGAELLINKGDMIVADGGNYSNVSSIVVSKEEIDVIKEYYT